MIIKIIRIAYQLNESALQMKSNDKNKRNLNRVNIMFRFC